MEAGDRFGDYVILKRLAAGGMAEVYLARKSGLRGFTKPVAMKVILPHLSSNERFIKMFLAEARLAVHLEHAHIAQTLDLGEVNGQYFIAMEFAHGVDLQRISSQTRKSGRLLPLPYAAKIVSQIAEGLFYAHTKCDAAGQPLGIIHRDISPHNILLTFDGLAKLIDFGVAKAKVTFMEEEEGVLKGKFSYMSPEQIRGMPLDQPSDIFALGIVLWEVCTGAHLYRESSELLTMEAILRKPVPRPRELRGDMPPDLEAIILKTLAKRSVDRFQTAHDLHVALEQYLSRSGWTVGTQHLSEFMKKLFPEELAEIRDLLQSERRRAEEEERRQQQQFVPWEPYQEMEEERREQQQEQLRAATSTPSPAAAAQPGSKPARRQRGEQKTPAPLLSRLTLVVVVLLVALAAASVYILLQSSSANDAVVDSQAVRPTSGSLEVQSVPSGARITINGSDHGVTPARIEKLPLDLDMTLRLHKPGYEDLLMPVLLTADNHQQVIRARLNRR